LPALLPLDELQAPPTARSAISSDDVVEVFMGGLLN